MSVFDNVAFGPRMKGVNGQTLKKQVLEALRVVNLRDFADHKPNQLSGGEQQPLRLVFEGR